MDKLNMVIIRNLKDGLQKICRFCMALAILMFLLLNLGCGKGKDEEGFTPDFTYSFKDDNHVQFENKSEGEYYSLVWDFGNGEKDTTVNKKQTYLVYYPLSGDYNVSLKLLDYSGNTKSTSKQITINLDDLLISFTAETDPVDPNIILLKNTTQGEYDSFTWIFRNREVNDQVEYSAYFPYSGSYEVVLKVVKNDLEITDSKNVTISQDDPDYIEHLSLVWSDEFDGTSVNEDYWTFETGANGWGNNELQSYTDGDNAEVTDGKLIITARKVDDNMLPGSYTSSRINTFDKKEFQYGRFEVRAKLPSGTGIWPAIWTLGNNFSTDGWPACGEIDIMEYVGYEPNTVHSTVHTPAGYGSSGNGTSYSLPSCEEEFHNYGLIWSEKKIQFYIDTPDNIIHTYAPSVKTPENWPFDRPDFLILNVAVGGNWGGAQGIDNSIFPQSMEIDYVRVYQENMK